MKRIERVFEYLQEVAKSQDGEKALTATAIADNLGILRSNVSRELNKLYRMGKIMKISGRPVLYKINDENINDKIEIKTVNKINKIPSFADSIKPGTDLSAPVKAPLICPKICEINN